MTIDVIIPTMLKPSLSRVHQHLAQIGAIGTIVIADFSPSFRYRREHRAGREQPVTKHVEIRGHKYFNKSIALNIGFHFTSAELVAVCDADILLESDFFAEAVRLFETRRINKLAVTPKYVKESIGGKLRPAPGICLLHKNIFTDLGGYCSEFQGWGLEDRDFLSRLEQAEVEIIELSWGTHLSHGNDERTKNYYSVCLAEMRQRNYELLCSRKEKATIKGTLTNDILSNDFYELT